MGENNNSMDNFESNDEYANELSAETQNDNSETIISTIFQRIIRDEEFKALLISDPDAALSKYELSDIQLILIKSLSEEDLGKLTPDNLDEFFAADAAVYTPDEADLLDFEAYDPEDFEEMD